MHASVREETAVSSSSLQSSTESGRSSPDGVSPASSGLSQRVSDYMYLGYRSGP